MEREIAARALTQDQLWLAVGSCPAAMVMTDADGTIVGVNCETESLFGYSASELLGQSVDLLVPVNQRPLHRRQRDLFKQVPQQRPLGHRRDLLGKRKNGTLVPVEVGLSTIHAGAKLFVLCAIIDLSPRKQLDHMKREFVSIVSHELRTPMTSVSASLALIAGGAAGPLPEQASRLATIALNNCNRLIRLLNDILDINKMASGKLAFDLKRTETRSLVEEAVNATRGYAETYCVNLRVAEGPGVTDALADYDRLTQAVVNLLSNAIKYSPVDGEVLVSIERRPDRVRISVQDHGPGVPPEFRSRIFERFSQADSPESRKKGGTGLGLHIVRQIAERMGGRAGFDDAADHGSIFWIEVPAWRDVAGSDRDACKEIPDPGERRLG